MTFRDDSPFRVSDAVRAGRTRASIDSRRFEMPFHGIRMPRGVDDLQTRCQAYALGVYLDLAWPFARFGYEYQGGHHVVPEQHAADVRRQERVHDIDWLLMEGTKYDLFDAPLETVARVRSRLEARGMRTRHTNPPIWALPRR